ncbi:DUF3376 domain-containing protein [Tessaracoccus caeni]|uniref:DUF3376 domain-containing protein n=1 Tax=Tessaracoccus caeni TaxID=3031239 RepID=UPI0023DA2E76|nr:DUF3376 domain-containing protein [Tessaracoccus caeni]MDF1487341.1 DUF3376 domain-containing protein [Tessaracoccus caeni]
MDKPELRFAVAMKGGVSLAVWIGGACRELTLLTAADPAYRELTSHLAGVKVDVISGSSAGGLNGVLLAQTEAYGAAFDHRTRNTWLKLADLGALARKTSDEVPLSLLRGDHAFYPLLAEQMRVLAPDGDGGGHGRVRLLVTTTRVHERPRELYPTVGPPVHAASSVAWFSFTSPMGGPAAQSHHITAEPDSMRRLAYAARCTSSFPGAFEPGRIDVGAGATPYPSMAGCCSETGADDDGRGTVEVMDGGVLDNIPIAWALRGIAAQPASGPVDRWLLYLDPSPSSDPIRRERTPAEMLASASPVGFMQLISRAKKVMGSVESLLDDGAELAAAGRATRAAEAALRVATSVGPADLDAAWQRIDEYALENGRAEAAHVRRLLLNPEGVASGDPLPVPPPLAGNGRERIPAFLRAATDDQHLVLGRPTGGWASLADVGALATTPLVAARALTVLLRSIQDVEAAADDDGPGFRAARLRLYAVRDVVEHVVALRDRHLLLAAEETTSLTQAHALATQRVARDLCHAVDGCPPRDLLDTQWWRGLLARLPSRAVAGSLDAPTSEAPYGILWDGVLACQESVIAVAVMRDLVAATAHWNADVLGASEVLTGASRPDPLSSPSDPAFAVISAAAPSPLAGMFWDDAATLEPDDLPGRKLCGNELFNFGGFLSARWRHHDWIWGRLDAIPTIMAALHHKRPDADDPFAVEDGRRVFRDGFGVSLGDELWVATGLEALWAEGASPRRCRIAVWAARRQLEILREERAFRVDTDEPPADLDFGPVDAPPAVGGDTADAWLDQTRRMAELGAENPIHLLSRPSLRRTLLRLGLGAFRGLTGLKPVDQGPPSNPAPPSVKTTGVWAFVLRALVGPFVVPPLLFSLTSPVLALVATVLSYVSLSFAVGNWATPVHLLFIPALVLAVVGIVLRGYRSRLTALAKGVQRAAWISAVGFVGLWLLIRAARPDLSTLGDAGPWVAGLLATVAFLATQVDAAVDALSGTQRGGAKQAKTLAVLFSGALVTGLAVALLALVGAPALIVLYAGLGSALLTLYYWTGLGVAPPIAYPVPGGSRAAL